MYDPADDFDIQLFTVLHCDVTCEQFLFEHKYPNGFLCAKCGHSKGYWLAEYGLIQCANKQCRHQTSPKSGTIFEHSPLPLSKWFQAIVFMCADKRSISAKELARRIEVNYKTALFMLRRLRSLMGCLLSSQVNDKVFAGVRCILKSKKRQPVQLGLVTGYLIDGKNAIRFVTPSRLGKVSHLPALNHESEEACEQPGLIGSAISLYKQFLLGTYHRSSTRYPQHYADEFAFRFNNEDTKERLKKFFRSCLSPPKQYAYTMPDPHISEITATYIIRPRAA